MVTGVGHISQLPDHCHALHVGERQKVAFVFEQHDALLGGLTGELAMGLAPNHVGGVVAGIAALCKTHLLPQQSQGRVVDPCERYLAALDQPFQMTVEQILERHFEILLSESGLFSLASRIPQTKSVSTKP